MHGALRQGAIKLPSDTHVSEAAHGKGLRHRAAVYVLGALATALTLALVASVTWLFTLDAPHTCGGSHLDKRHVHHHLVRRDAGYDTGKGYELPDESLAFPKPVNVSAGRFPKYDALLKGNKEWIDSVNATDPSLFEEMGSGQSPPFLYIGCADSRVPFSVITEQHPGQIFVQRNAGNQYLYWDENSMTSLGFSVEVLGISSILVVGHTGCGAVATAYSTPPPDEQHSEDYSIGLDRVMRWIKPIRDVFLQSNNTVLAEARKKYAPNPPPAPESYDDPIFVALVEENAKANARNVISDPVVRQSWQRWEAAQGNDKNSTETELWVHTLVFDVSTGVLRDLGYSFGPSSL